MQFGQIPVAAAAGAILAHSVALGSRVLKKGRLLTVGDVAALQLHGVAKVFAARLEPGDVAEDDAAQRLAQAMRGIGITAQAPFTGRANLHAEAAGLVQVDPARVTAFNHISESMTLATLAPYSVVQARQMVATVKIIPFAVSAEVLAEGLRVIGAKPMVEVQPFQQRRIGLVLTEVTGMKPGLVKKSEVTMADRLHALGAGLAAVETCAHDIAAVQGAIARMRDQGCDMLLLFGASAIVDRGDVVPAGLVAAGGRVVHLGMPVDPGNLMMLGHLGDLPVIGVPSCARSPKTNGFDFVLQRVVAGLPVTAQDIMAMGTGGLLAEISSRPAPREGRAATALAPRVAAVVLAAGKSSRMGSNKLLAEVGGRPMLARVLAALEQAELEEIVVVTGHEAAAAAAQVDVARARLVHNPDYAQGLSTSVRAGIAALGRDIDAAFVVLGDMPLISAWHLQRLIAAYSVADHRTICVPVHEGRRGNPVLWGAMHFAALRQLAGDEGARQIMDGLADELVEVAMPDDGVLRDADTPQALQAVRSAFGP
jgi:molybdenum cofactor cytidylyltransferase